MKKVFNFGIIVIISLVFVFMTSLQGFAAETNTILNDQVSITDSVGNGSGDAAKYTVTAKGSLLSKQTNTITITNETAAGGKISFDYSVAKASSFTIDGVSDSASGSYTATLAAGGTVVIKITSNSGFSNLTVTLTLTNFNFEISTGSEITFEFDNTLGTLTADGTNINSGDKKEVPAGETIEMTATPVSEAVFLGWIDVETNKIVSRDTTCTYKPDSDKTIKALFAKKGVPYFLVGDIVYSDFDTAMNAGTNIVLMCNAVLPAGDYIIPEGKTLLIPFDDANTLYTTTRPAKEDIDLATNEPFVYRTLKLESGANITVNGTICVPAKHSYKQLSNGSPVGAYGHIDMDEGSTITVDSDANLYAWGYITGSGKITAKSGATIYEYFQVRDYRGGTVVSGMITDNSKEVFPMSQYYVQNIEVPLTLEAGAIETGYMSVHVPLGDPQSCNIPFIGSKGMFRIQSGSITKDYDESTDRLIINVDGTLEMSSLSITMGIVSSFISQTINSEEYVLPINGNITLNVNSGSVVNVSQRIALLPGAEINVYKDARCTFASGAAAFVYDSAEWGGYCCEYNYTFMAVHYAPGRKYTRTEGDLKDAKVYIEGKVDAYEGIIYTTASGADVQGAEGGLVKIKYAAPTVTYQATQCGSDRREISYDPPIPVITAPLKNKNGTYTDPEKTVGCNSTYIYSNEKWVPNHNFSEEWTTDVEPTCTIAGSKSHHCINCGEKTDITVIDALGHDIVNHEAQAPTCEAIGWNEYETCSRCDYTTYEEIASLGHIYGEWIAVDATNHKKVCENDGSHVITEEHTLVDFVCTACGYEKIATNTTYEIADEKITINTVLNFEISDDAQIMIATYTENGSLLNVAIKTPSTLEAVTFSSKDVAKIKVFVWDGFDTMKPVSSPEEITVTANNN